MSSISERFENRKNRAMEFAVRFPLGDNPSIEFTVRRIPEPVDTQASNKALGALRDQGIDPTTEGTLGEYFSWKGYFLVEQAAKFFTGWKSLVGDELKPFSQAIFAEFLGILSPVEKQMLGLAYITAVREADEKKEPSENSGEGS